MQENIQYFNNIIIGAGPAGLQLGYYFEKYYIEYIILERNTTAGSIYEKIPHSNELLSINKKNNDSTNLDFNLRHDWNSLLNDENFLFTNYSDDYYPSKNIFHKYLNDFSLNFNLKIKYNENVINISYDKNILKYLIYTELNIYKCDKLIISTGLSELNIPKCKKYITNKENIKHYLEFDKNYFLESQNLNKFKNKSVLLVGLGNSSLELSNLLLNYCSNILITGNNRDLSIISHYDGDLRSKYLNFFDSFFLNGMNGIDNKVLTDKDVIIENTKKNTINNGKYYIIGYNEDQILFCNSVKYFDYIIFCTGKKFDLSIFDKNINIIMDGKYPKLNLNYQSINNDKLFFIGSLMYSFDSIKNSGNFIKGYRHLIKLFFKKNYIMKLNKVINFKLDNTFKMFHDLAYHIYNRINYSSILYNLPDYVVDIFYYDKESQQIKYYIDVIKFDLRMIIIDENDTNYLCILKLAYGDKIEDIKKLGIYNKFKPSLLHPEIELLIKNENNIFVLKDKIVFEENLVGNFNDKEIYYDKLVRILKALIII